MEAEHTNIQKWIRGSFKPKDMTKHLFISTLGIASLLFLSYRCYMQENPYSIFTNLISDLGNWQTNPRGWWIFSLAMVFSGLMTLPIISYVKRNLEFTKKTAITMGAWTLKANTIGTILIGFVPLVREPTGMGISFYDLHAFITYLSLIFYFVGMSSFVAFVLKNPKINSNTFPNNNGDPFSMDFTAILPFAVLYMIVLLLAIITQFFSEILWVQSLERFYAREFWEWMLFFSYFLVNYPFALCVASARNKANLSE